MSCLRKNVKKTAPACAAALKAYDAAAPRGGVKKRRGGAGVSAARC